ncbi:hypothetical protein BT93_L5370 [Corymbia citriodora subsp. variegata]|uniref:Uncharacterized protein n=1 Tax=Corymbia citriodora subsp. variegata TaxID=360336 RepID=A0A8T0CXA7_CORYI|nr:hypothetical protein BT93_L5370 [Corymbia citriodora subsp. variegata]KAF7852223.1 hypothetical protein BT93_L5370 [Corymbia citriodora subsp. variegata]
MGTRVKIRRFVIMSVKTCYRSVCNHPFLVGMLCFLFFMYRSFPFLFSLLVSASPVLVCTAVLLGTLLSFGQPNIPEIEKEERITHDVAPLKAGVVHSETVITHNKDCVMERFVGTEREVADRAVQEVGSPDGKTSIVEEDDGLLETSRLINDGSQENQGEKQVYEEAAKGFHDMEQENDACVHDEKSDVDGHEDGGHQYTLIQEEEFHTLERENGGMARDSTDAHLESRLGSKWKERDEEEDEDEMSEGSDSDHSESSSPDASMADIMPMLDELHPLLDVEAPQPAHLPLHDSDVASQHSSKSENGILESDEDNKNEEGDDENDGEEEEEEEEESQRGKEDESKSVITWTEDDQKNLMDLGTSELERNQRLENLIARRRARKNLRTMTEKNLIDFDSDDLPFNVPPIATMRRNPFDGPDDSSYNVGLPPIPGSAPSIMLARRNPFDIPYEPNEEKPDLKGDSFQQEFETFHQRDTFYRRHESFSLGPSNLGVPKQEKQDSKLRPYFVPEQFASVGTSFHPMERQSSEVSVTDSKVSSVPDTESLSSNADHDDKRVSEHDSSQETEGISNVDQASLLVEHGSQTSEDVDSHDIEDVEENVIHREEIAIILGNVDGQHELESNLPETGEPTDSLHSNVNETQQKVEAAEEEYSSGSSSSFFSEVNETVADVKQEELVTSMDDPGEEPSLAHGHQVEDLDFTFMAKAQDVNPHKEPVYDSSPPAVEKYLSFKSISSDVLGDVSEMSSTPESVRSACVDKESEGPGEMLKEEPNYEEMFAAASQVHAENDDELSYKEVAENAEENTCKGEQPMNDELGGKGESLVPRTASERVSTGPSLPSWSESMGEDRIREHDSHNEHSHLMSSSSDTESPNWIQQSEGERQDSEQVEIRLSFRDGPSEAVSPFKDDSVHHEQLQVNSGAASETSNTNGQHLSEHVDMEISLIQQVTFDDLHSSTPDEQPTSPANETVSVIHEYSSSTEPERMKEHSFDKEDITQYVENQVHSSTSDAVKDAGASLDVEAKAVSHGSTYDQPSEDKLSLETQQSCSDKTIQPPINDPNGEEELSPTVAEPVVEIVSPSGIDAKEMCDVEEKTLTDSSTLTHDFTSNPDETLEYVSPTGAAESRDVDAHDTVIGSHGQVMTYSEQLAESFESHVSGESMHEEVDDIKEIDEEFLRELDNVGDFRVKEADDDFLSSKLLPGEASLGTYDSESTFKDQEPEERSLKSPVVEARSIEDVTLTFRKLHEGGDLVEPILPCPIVNEQSINDSNIEDENNSDLQIDEAGSLQETHINTEHISEEFEEGQLNIHKSKPAEADEGSSTEVVESDNVESGVSETKSVSFDEPTTSKEIESNPSLPVLEVKSLDDIAMAFRQLDEGANVEEVIVPSSIGVQEDVDGSEHRGGMNSGLHVVEARSLDDILVIMNRTSEDNQEVMGKDMHYEDTKVNSMKRTESQSVEFSAQETQTVTVDKSVGLDEIESSLSSPVHEERSVDVAMQVKQSDEGKDVEEVVHLHSTSNQQGVGKSKLNSGLELEKSSSDVDHITEKQNSGDVQRGLPEDIHSEEKSTVAEAVTEVSTETTESSKTQTGVQETPAIHLEKTKDSFDGPSDLASVSPRDKKVKHSKSSSSSSSGSSSSSSDSDQS